MFILACGAFVASIGYLGVALTGNGSSRADDASPFRDAPTATPTPVFAPNAFRFTGDLPRAVEGLDLRPADNTHTADFVFAGPAGAGVEVALRRFVPVVPLWAGLEGVSGPVLASLVEGRATFAEAGGLGGKPTPVALAADAAAIAAAVPGFVPRRTFESAAAMAAAFSDPAGEPLIAFVPVMSLRPAFAPLAIDGIDLLRAPAATATWPYAERIHIQALSSRGSATLPVIVTALNEPPPSTTTIVATGDILMSRCTLTKIRATGDWGSPLRTPVGRFLFSAGLTLGSLDGSIQDIGLPNGCIETTNLTSPPEVIEALTLAGFDGLTVATNHIADCGQGSCGGSKAIVRTLELLEKAGITTVGGGRNLEEALAPAIFTVHGVRIGVLGFDDIAAEDLEATDTAPGTAPLDDNYADEKAAFPREPAFYKPAELLGLFRFQDRIRKLKAQVDIVVVQVQSGYEDTHDASPRSIKALRAAADAGADLVIGNQGHWVQPVEFRGNTFVAYALGNFIFDQRHTPEHYQGYLVEATLIANRVASVRLLPYQIVDQYRPEFVDGALRLKIFRDVFEASARLPR